MAYLKQVLALVLICLCVLINNAVEGTKFVTVEGVRGQTEAKHAGFFISNNNFMGTRARISTWSIPNVSAMSESAAFIAVLDENTNYSMVAGFHVYPRLYSGNTELRLFAAWEADKSGMTMCYSVESGCQGFVLSNVTGAPVPGQTFAPLSTYNGKDYFVTLSIKKDDKTQDWSLYRDDNDNPILIGWWPKTLFNNTFDYATKVIWAGSVLYPKNETSPPMGSGHPAAEGANKAAYISNIKIFDHSGQTDNPDQSHIKGLTDRVECFTTDDFKYSRKKDCNFFYGGSAGCN